MISQIGQSLLKQHEGVKLRPYRCTADKITIGVGRNLDDIGISMEEAEYLFHNDLKRVEKSLNTIEIYYDLDDVVRQYVLFDMCFNIGLSGLKRFKKMWQALEDKHYGKAADEMLDSKWAKQVGSRAIRLAKMMRTGTWPY